MQEEKEEINKSVQSEQIENAEELKQITETIKNQTNEE